ETPLPLLEMYTRGVHFFTGRVNARPLIPEILELVRAGGLHPEHVNSAIIPWDDADRAILADDLKPVFVRRTPMNDLLVRVCLAVLLVASAEASELLSPDSDGCTYETFEKATELGWPTGQKVYTGQKISLDFKDGEIVNVLRILSEVGG